MWNNHGSTGTRGKHHRAAEIEYHKGMGGKKKQNRGPPYP